MNHEKKLVPKLRFPEFTDAWEQRKLGNVVDVYDGTHQTPRYTDSGVMFLSVENITSLQSEKFISEEDFLSEFKIYPEMGDVLMTRIGDVGTTNVITTNKPIAYYVSLALLKNKGIEPYFLSNSISSISVQHDIWKRTLHIAFPKKINKNEIEKIVVALPKFKEQQKIGTFFTALDRYITIHQRKLENVKKLKKSLLQKMFPKNDQKFPEIRFPEFTYAWERRKLGDVAKFNPKSILPNIFKYVDLESVIGTELLGYKTENKYFAPSRAQRLAQKGDIFYQTVRPYQKNNYLFDFEDKDFVFSTGYAQLRPQINGYFLFSQLQEDSFVHRVLDKCTGTSYPAINGSDLSEISIKVPDNPKEQQKIGKFFTALDRYITIHQRKLENVKKLKKSLLQQMFV